MPRIGFQSSTASRLRAGAKAEDVEFSGPIILVDQGLVYIELRPDLDYDTIRGQAGVPTLVTRGIFRGFSLPEYVAEPDNYEQLFATICVPSRYAEASAIIVPLYCWLAIAEDSKNFNLELGWEHYTPGTDIVPATSHLIPVETATGASAAQFQSYKVSFTLDYDVHDPNNIVGDDIMGLRVRRLAATPPDCVGEIVIDHYGVIFRRNKLGTLTP